MRPHIRNISLVLFSAGVQSGETSNRSNKVGPVPKDARQQRGDGGEGGNQQQGKARAGLGAVHDGIHCLHVGQQTKRTAISRSRPEARAISRLATLAQAIRSTSPTTTINRASGRSYWPRSEEIPRLQAAGGRGPAYPCQSTGGITR